MRKQDIVKGGIYWDGNMGVRQILDIGPQYRVYSHRADRDCVQFQVLSDCKHGVRRSKFDEASIRTSARQSFATWAESRLEGDAALAQVMESIHAKCLRLRAPVAEAILDAASQHSSDKLARRHVSVAHVDAELLDQLRRMGLVEPGNASGQRVRNLMFTSLGIKVVERLRQGEQA